MARLSAALRASLAGRGHLAMVSGDAGIGKTRIAEQISEEATRLGFAVLWGRSIEAREAPAPPYWPWVQALRGLIRSTDDAALRADMGQGAADIAGVLPEVAERLGVEVPKALEDAEQGRFRLFDSVAVYLQRASARRPLVIVLENLQWAGRPSLLLLEFLAQALADSPVLVIGTYRGAEVSRRHPLFETLGALNREPGFFRIRLQGLESGTVARFVEAIAGFPAGSTMPSGLIDAIRQRTEGNPFFVSEVIRLLVDEGILAPGQSTMMPANGQPLVVRIPEGITEVIWKRLNRLSDPCNRVLSHAAVIGREFELDVLRLLLDDMSGDAVLASLAEATAADVVGENVRVAGRYRFNHALIREALYDELSGASRARHHARVGAILEQVHAADLAGHLSELAHHFFEAARGGGGRKAMDYAIEAGRQAESVLAYEEAARFYQIALDALERGNPHDENLKCELLLGMTRSLGNGGRVHEALELIPRVAELARWRMRTDVLLGACRVMDRIVSTLGVAADILPVIERTMSLLDDSDSAPRAWLLGVLARACYNSGQPVRAQAAARDSIAMARRLGDASALVSALHARLYPRYPPEDVDERLAAAREMLALAAELDDLGLVRDAHDFCFYDLMEKGDVVAADEHLARSGALGRELRQPFHIHNHLVYRTMRVVLEGDYAEGEQLSRAALAAGQRIRRDAAEGIFGMQMFTMRRDQGRLGELAGVMRAFVEGRQSAAAWRPGLALMYAELGLVDEARAELRDLVRDDCIKIARDALWPTCLVYLAEVADALRDRQSAGVLRRLLAPYAGQAIVVGAGVAFLGAASHYLGMLARLLDCFDAAAADFEAALSLNTRMGAHPWIARTQAAYAALLHEQGVGHQRARAEELFAAALATARRLGMSALESRLIALDPCNY
jgi:tetratricopeptide (TPR) repeat protein